MRVFVVVLVALVAVAHCATWTVNNTGSTGYISDIPVGGIAQGDTVVFSLTGSSHTVTEAADTSCTLATNASGYSFVELFNPGGTFTFGTVGGSMPTTTFFFYCVPHCGSDMKSSFVIQGGAPVSTTTSDPTTTTAAVSTTDAGATTTADSTTTTTDGSTTTTDPSTTTAAATTDGSTTASVTSAATAATTATTVATTSAAAAGATTTAAAGTVTTSAATTTSSATTSFGSGTSRLTLRLQLATPSTSIVAARLTAALTQSALAAGLNPSQVTIRYTEVVRGWSNQYLAVADVSNDAAFSKATSFAAALESNTLTLESTCSPPCLDAEVKDVRKGAAASVVVSVVAVVLAVVLAF